MIKKICCALLLGIVAALFILQHDASIKALIGAQCQKLFMKALDCNTQLAVESIHFFSGKLVFKEVTTTPRNHADWQWYSKKFIVQFSLWDLFSHGKIGMHLTLEDLAAKTGFTDSTIAIIPHLKQTMIGFSPDVPILLKTLRFVRAQIRAIDAARDHTITLAWDSTLYFTEDRLKALFYCTDGTGTIAKQPVLDSLLGTVSMEIPYDMVKPWYIVTDLCGHSLQLPIAGINCFCTGTINNKQGTFTLRSIDDSVRIDPLTIDFSNLQNTILTATINLSIKQLLSLTDLATKLPALDGYCSINARYIQEAEKSALDGTITTNQIIYHNCAAINKCKLSFTKDNNVWRGNIAIRYNENLGAHGLWEWDTNKQKGHAHFTNNKEISYSNYSQWIAPEQAKISLAADNQYNINGTYKATIANRNTNSSIKLDGNLNLNQQEISLEGTINEHRYKSVLSWQPNIGIKEFVYQNGKGEKLIAIHGRKNDTQRFSGFITLPCINAITEALSNYTVQGTGNIDLFGIIKPGQLLLKTTFTQGMIRLPQTYNCINNFEATTSFDFAHKQAIINNLQCKLYVGSCSIRRAIVTGNDQWQPITIHLPIILDHCQLNIKKDLFAIVSGNLLIEKQDQKNAYLKGHVILNRSQLADNIFSGTFHETLAQYTKETSVIHGADMDCNLTLETEHPIRIRNSFFDTQARIAVQIKGRLYSPSLIGSVTLNGGSLLFPYKPLIITKGNLIVNTQQLDDPLFELIAKNKIKKYVVTLTVAGSLNHHQISLSSTPPLSDEQIIGLLLLGFEEVSLSSIAPALVLNNLTSLLFGSNPTSLLQRSLASLPESLKRVHFIPSFNDQSGRGGLRGNLEIDINDRWHASIQKNFNLQEDTHFELEYLLSDDISLKGIRDERRDVSSEIEMRFKF